MKRQSLFTNLHETSKCFLQKIRTYFKMTTVEILYNLLSVKLNTVNPLYTDTRYSDKIHYHENLTVTKPSL